MLMKMAKVYFYCRNEEGNLQEDIITLAEGFRELGVPYFANCDYWLQSTEPGDYLFRHSPDVTPDNCDIVVVSYTWPSWIRMKTFDLVRRPLPESLFKPGRKYQTVYMDHHDGHRTVSWEPEFRQFDLILRAKLNCRAWRPSNLRPWAYGLCNRILRATEGGLPFAQRQRAMLVNYGASHPFPHGTRTISAAVFEPQIELVLPIDRTRDDLNLIPSDPYESLMWRQTGGRYSAAYYSRLKSVQAVACFCGDLIPPLPHRNPECYLVGGNRARVRRLFYETLGRLDPRPNRAVQWDSFRFWETLMAGSVAFNIDLAHYGVEIPVMPENWKHYIGVDFARVDAVIERLLAEPEVLERIASAGRAWALEHYSPRAMAVRFLKLMDFETDSSPAGVS